VRGAHAQPKRAGHREHAKVHIEFVVRFARVKRIRAVEQVREAAPDAVLPVADASAHVFERRSSVYSGNQRLDDRDAELTHGHRPNSRSSPLIFSAGRGLFYREKWLYVGELKAVIREAHGRHGGRK
jgi:hypothetical protein